MAYKLISIQLLILAYKLFILNSHSLFIYSIYLISLVSDGVQGGGGQSALVLQQAEVGAPPRRSALRSRSENRGALQLQQGARGHRDGQVRGVLALWTFILVSFPSCVFLTT